MTRQIAENLFLELGELLNSNLDKVTILRTFCNRILAIFDAERVSILSLDPLGQNLTLTAWAGRYPEDMDRVKVPLGEGVSGWVAATGDDVLVSDVDKDIRFSAQSGERYRTKSFISVPLKSRGQPLGVLNITDTSINEGFTRENLLTLKSIALQVGMGMENLSLNEEIEGISLSRNSLITALYEMKASPRDIENGLIPTAVRGANSVLGPFSHMILAGEMGGNRSWAGTFNQDEGLNIAVMDFGSGHSIYQEMAANSLQPPYPENQLLVELGFQWDLLQTSGFRLIRSLLPPRANLFGILLSIIPEGSIPFLESRKVSQNILTQFSGLLLEEFLDRQMIRKLDHLKTELISTVSHELRTPLTSIQGFSEFLIRSDNIPESLERYLHIINNESRRLNRLINDFLDLARFESGQLTLTKEPFDPLEVLESAVKLLNPQAESGKATIRIHTTGDLPHLIADRDRVEQALVNLIGNAIKYGETGVKIDISLHSEDGRTIFEISDNGPGIPEEELPLVFNRFFRGIPHGLNERNHDSKGTGLGLSLTKEIVERHGGTISVSSTPGEKTTFRFSVPTLGLVSPQRGITAWHPGDEEFTGELANRLAEGKTVGVLTVHVNPGNEGSSPKDDFYSVEVLGEIEEALLRVMNDGAVEDNFIQSQPQGEFIILTYTSLVDQYADLLIEHFQDRFGGKYNLALGAAVSSHGEKPRPEKLIALSRQACLHVEKTRKQGYLKNRRM